MTVYFLLSAKKRGFSVHLWWQRQSQASFHADHMEHFILETQTMSDWFQEKSFQVAAWLSSGSQPNHLIHPRWLVPGLGDSVGGWCYWCSVLRAPAWWAVGCKAAACQQSRRRIKHSVVLSAHLQLSCDGLGATETARRALVGFRWHRDSKINGEWGVCLSWRRSRSP